MRRQFFQITFEIFTSIFGNYCQILAHTIFFLHKLLTTNPDNCNFFQIVQPLFSDSKNLQNPILYANFKDDDLYLRHVMRSTEKLYPMLTSANWLDNEVKNYLQFRKIYVKNQVIDPDVFLIMSTLDVSKYVFIIYRKVSLISRYIQCTYS